MPMDGVCVAGGPMQPTVMSGALLVPVDLELFILARVALLLVLMLWRW